LSIVTLYDITKFGDTSLLNIGQLLQSTSG